MRSITVPPLLSGSGKQVAIAADGMTHPGYTQDVPHHSRDTLCYSYCTASVRCTHAVQCAGCRLASTRSTTARLAKTLGQYGKGVTGCLHYMLAGIRRNAIQLSHSAASGQG